MATRFGTFSFVAAAVLVASAAVAQQNPARPAQPRAANPDQRSQQVQQQQGQQRGQLPGQQGQSATQGQRVTANRVGTEGAATNNDHIIANLLAISNEEEVTVARGAESKLQSEEAKRFAQMMVKDHGQMLQQLQQHGAQPVRLSQHQTGSQQGAGQQQGSQRENQQNQNAQNQNAQNQNAQSQQQTSQQRTAGDGQQQQAAGAGGQRPFHFLEVKREIAERCIASADKELNSKQGKERDECFIGMQIAKHQESIDAQKVLREYASPELQQVIDKGVQSAESHLQEAKHLIRQLASDRGGRGDEKSNDDKSNQ